MRRGILIGISIALVIIAGVVVAVIALSDGSMKQPDPEGSAIPSPFPTPSRADRDLTTTFLGRAGAPLLRVHRVAASATQSSGTKACEKVIARLDRIATGEEAAALVGGIPDDVLRGLFDEERRALGVRLTSCVTRPGDSDAATTSAEDLRARRSLVTQRLNQLGVEQ